jgi:hypothetical protein
MDEHDRSALGGVCLIDLLGSGGDGHGSLHDQTPAGLILARDVDNRTAWWREREGR